MRAVWNTEFRGNFRQIDPVADGEVIAVGMAMESIVHGIIRLLTRNASV